MRKDPKCEWNSFITSIAITMLLTLIITGLISHQAKGQGIPIMGECINSSYLRTYTRINISGVEMPVEVTNVYCPQGCVSDAGQYGADCAEKPVTGMMLEIFIFLFILSIGSLVVGIVQRKWLFCMFSTIMFLVLSFQGFRIEVISGGLNIVYQDIIIVLLSWLGGIVSFVFTLLGMLAARKDRISKRDMEIAREFKGGIR